MKNGTHYAKRLKRTFGALKQEYGVPEIPPPSDGVDQLLLAILQHYTSDAKAVKALKQLRDEMVDINEARVTTVPELVAVFGDQVPHAAEAAGVIHRALNAVFYREHTVTLDMLQRTGRREAKAYLDSLDGVDAYCVASVRLWSLGGHAIPMSAALFQALHRAELIDPSATPDEAQAFLERNVPAAEAKVFCLLMPRLVVKGPPGGEPRTKPSRHASDGKGARGGTKRGNTSGKRVSTKTKRSLSR